MVYEELVAARKAFLGTVGGLSDAEWRMRAADGAWSVAEIAEHVTLVSTSVGAMVRGALLATPVEESTGEMEARIRRFLPDRARKVPSPERFLPVGTWGSRDEVVAAYTLSRDELLAWLRDTTAPLRSHRLPHPRLGPMDGVEWLVFLAAHDQRHVAQIRETLDAV